MPDEDYWKTLQRLAREVYWMIIFEDDDGLVYVLCDRRDD